MIYHYLVINPFVSTLCDFNSLQAKLDRYLHFIKKKVERYNNSPQVTANNGGADI